MELKYETLFNLDGSIKSKDFYCTITNSNYRIISTTLHYNKGFYVIGAEHRVKRLKDDKIRLFQERELRQRFTKVKIIC